MDPQTIDNRTLDLIAEAVPARFRRTPVTPDARLKHDLGLNSIGMLALLFRLEESFGIDLATVDIGVTLAQLTTVGDLLEAARAVVERADAS